MIRGVRDREREMDGLGRSVGEVRSRIRVTERGRHHGKILTMKRRRKKLWEEFWIKYEGERSHGGVLDKIRGRKKSWEEF